MPTRRPRTNPQESARATLDLDWRDEPVASFDVWEKRTYDDVMEAERPVDEERHAVMAECDSTFLGGENQFLIKSRVDGFPIVEERDPDEIFFVDDQFGPLVETNCTQFVRSRGTLKFMAPPDEQDSDQIARVATSIWVHYQEKLLRQDFLQREARRLMLHGGAWRYLFFDPQAGGKAKKPRVERSRRQLAPSAFLCPECGAQGPVEAAEPPEGSGGSVPQENAYHTGPAVAARPVCPDCGYDDLVVVDVPEAEFDEQTGWDMETRGDLAVDQPDGYEMTTNSWARSWKDTIFLRRKRRLDVGVIRSMFRYANLSEYDESDDDGGGLRYQRTLEVTFDTVRDLEAMAHGATRLGRERDYVEVWYMPTYYEGVVLEEDFVLYEGTEDEEVVAEAGVPLDEQYPNGMRVCKSGSEILGVFEEDFHDKVVYYRYRIAPGRFYGKGVEGACALQRWLNELVSLVMTFVMTSASPTFLFDESAMPDGMPPAGTPSQRIPVSNRPMDVSMDQIVKIVPPGALAQGVFEMFVRVKEEMQSHIGAFSFFAGNLPDAAKATATGLSIVQEQAAGLMMMPLALRAEADARFGEMVLHCFSTYVRDERYVQIAGPYSEAEMDGMFISGAMLPEGITAVVEPSSYYPRLSYQLKNDALEYFKWRSEFIVAHQRPPSPTEEQVMAERFGIPELMQAAMIAGRRERQNFELQKDYLDRFESGQLTPEEQLDLVFTIEQQTQQIVAQAQMQMQQAAEMGMAPVPVDVASLLPDPTQVVVEKAMLLAPIWPEQEKDAHAGAVEWLKRYALQDRGYRETPLVKRFIEERIKARRRAMAEVQANEQMDLQTAMMPVAGQQAAFEAESAAATSHAQTAGERAEEETGGEQTGARRDLPPLPYQRQGLPAQMQSPVG